MTKNGKRGTLDERGGGYERSGKLKVERETFIFCPMPGKKTWGESGGQKKEEVLQIRGGKKGKCPEANWKVTGSGKKEGVPVGDCDMMEEGFDCGGGRVTSLSRGFRGGGGDGKRSPMRRRRGMAVCGMNCIGVDMGKGH